MPSPGWKAVYDQLSQADRASPLPAADVERLAMAAHLTGRDVESIDLLARAHAGFLDAGDPTRAARAAFWIGFVLMNKGERARAAGWLARAGRLVDEYGHDCVERGYLMLPLALQQIGQGQIAAAERIFADAATIGERFGEGDLVNLARQGRGRCLIALGDISRGLALLDEVMIAVTSGEVSAIVAGVIYCSVVSACFEISDMRRAQEWTEALKQWCASQPDMVSYRGECLVHRSEIMALHGVWPAGLDEARRACECLSQPPGQPALGAAFYQVGELHRMRGAFGEAEEAYRRASEAGRPPQPGLALLRLMQGRHDAAKASISRVVEEARDRRTRSRALAASVEILLAADEVAPARAAADELSSIAGAVGTPLLRAIAAHAAGAVLLAEGDAKHALTSLRDACALWRDLEAPYEAARTTVLIGLACRALGDADSAELELNAAIQALRQLGAAPDLARVEHLREPSDRSPVGPLTAREIQVLKLVASGKTNRSIAQTLSISEKTVARHVSNIFTKLDLPSRSAATAYAFRHRLI